MCYTILVHKVSEVRVNEGWLYAGLVDKLDSCRRLQPCTMGTVSALEWRYGLDVTKAPPMNELA